MLIRTVLGYIQVDLPPDTLFEAETAIAAAQKIWRSVGWSNLLLRIPATRLMLPVIEQLLREGMNVMRACGSSMLPLCQP